MLAVLENFPQRLMDLQASVVIYVAPPSEAIHKGIYARPRSADHLRKHLMTDKWNFYSGRTVFIQVREAQQHARETLLRGGSEQISDVFAILFYAGEQIRDQRIGSFIFSAKHAQHLLFIDCANRTGGESNGGGSAQGIPGQAKLAEKITHAEQGGDGRGTMFRARAEPHAAFLDIEERGSGSALQVDILFIAITRNLAPETGA